MFAIHDMSGVALNSDIGSVFGTRDPHFLLEMLGAVVKENREQALDLSTSLWQDFKHIESWNFLPSTYISLEPAGQTPGDPLSKIFGSNDQEVRNLKGEYDLEDVFDLALPKLKSYL
jgi:hypothetical protein